MLQLALYWIVIAQEKDVLKLGWLPTLENTQLNILRLGHSQGPRSNFEIGGGGGAPLVTQYWGVTRHFFSLTLYNFKNIGRAHAPPPSLPPYSAVPDSALYNNNWSDYLTLLRHDPSRTLRSSSAPLSSVRYKIATLCVSTWSGFVVYSTVLVYSVACSVFRSCE